MVTKAVDEVEKALRRVLDRKRVGYFTTHVTNVKRVRFAEERYFELYLKDERGHLQRDPAVKGIYFAGRNGIRAWVEADVRHGELERELFSLISKLIPAGGHLMVIYAPTPGEHLRTAEELKSGVPPAATPLGYLMWQVGFRAFKDWYFPEGWKEGDTKLQGDKAVDAAQEKEMRAEVVTELKKWLAALGPEDHKRSEDAVRRAKEIIKGEV